MEGGRAMSTRESLPLLLTASETATLLRTTRKAVYAMIERGLLPGVTRIGRRVLVRSGDLLDFLDHNRAPSPQEYRR
jgi:excisionase family DNA binding protein